MNFTNFIDFLNPAAIAQTTGDSATASNPLFTLLPLVLFAVVFYFLLIRPQTKRQKEHQKMVSALAKGDEIITTAGVAGRIIELGENFALVEIAEGVRVKLRRSAVETILPKGSLKEL